MKERPILYSGPMVRANLEGRKTQTRRVMKPQPPDGCEYVINGANSHALCRSIENSNLWVPPTPRSVDHRLQCPYGKPGDRLWVKEEHYRFGHWEQVPGVKTKTGRMKWRFVADTNEVLFDAPQSFRKGRHHHDPFTPHWHKRLARFMAKSICRLWNDIESVRVERLQEIKAGDAWAEGVPIECCAPLGVKSAGGQGICPDYVGGYRSLWESINGPGSWESNPWVWVITFRRVQS